MNTPEQPAPHSRCAWAGDDPLYCAYHDDEWGVPCRDDGRLFEMLILEGAQAGLAWITVLRKREGYRRAFDGFDPVKIAAYDTAKLTALRADPGIVRNRLKIESTVSNARAFLAVQATYGNFADFLWGFVDGRPVQNRWSSLAEVPARTPLSDSLSRELKRHGFKFVGSTICYAYLQAVGLINDHLTGCFRHAELSTAET